MLDRRTTKKSLGVTFIGTCICVFVFGLLIFIGGFFGLDLSLLYQGEGVPFFGNLFGIGIPVFIGAYIAQIFDYNPS